MCPIFSYKINVMSFTDKLKNKPTHRILARVKCHFAHKWKDVAYELLVKNPEKVQSIDNDKYKSMEEKCFDMLDKWLKTSSNPTYYDLIKALKQHDLEHAVEFIKEQVLAS